MTRKTHLIRFLAVFTVTLAVVGRSLADGSSDATTVAVLADQIDAQTEATKAALALANDVWVPRVAGLGLGLAVGLIAGGATAYLTWGDER